MPRYASVDGTQHASTEGLVSASSSARIRGGRTATSDPVVTTATLSAAQQDVARWLGRQLAEIWSQAGTITEPAVRFDSPAASNVAECS
jgi:hypothetical protein